MAKKKSGSKKRARRPRPKPWENPKFTVRQSKFVKAFMEKRARSLAELAEKADYSLTNARNSGYQAFQAIKRKAPEILEQIGFSLPKVMDIHLRRQLAATTVKIAQHEGRITDVIEVDDNAAQGMALDKIFRLYGAYAPKEQILQQASQVRVVILDAPRPGRPVPKIIEVGGNGSSPTEKK